MTILRAQLVAYLALSLLFHLASAIYGYDNCVHDARSFSCAISTYTLKAGDPPYQVCEIRAVQPDTNTSQCVSFLSMQWFTGTFDKPYGSESVLISM
jgi:hypothetical protein